MTSVATGAAAPRKPDGLVERRLMAPLLAESALFLGYAMALYLVPLCGSVALASQHATPVAMVARLVLTVLSGYGLFVLATVGHEGFHFNLARRPSLSCRIGCVFSSLMPLFCATGFFLFHWRHHRHNNQPVDPDYAHFIRFDNFLLRVGVARVIITSHYLAVTVDTAFNGLRGATQVPISDPDARRLARFNLACQCGWLAAYGVACLAVPGFLLAWLPVLGAATAVSSLNAYQEHAFQQGTPQPFARSRTSRVLTWLHAGSNFHVEHHLYPSVPCWRLPRVHRLLVGHGWYQDKQHLLDAGILGTLKFAFANYRYGGQTPRGKS
jgi:beta-carotene hydroxylase